MPKDHLSDFIIRFKNRQKSQLRLYNTKKMKQIINLLKEENYIDFKIVNETVKELTINITKDHIKSMKIISKQSRYQYKSYNDLLTDSKKNIGFYILTNSEWGWITSHTALNKKVGGKVILWVNLFLD